MGIFPVRTLLCLMGLLVMTLPLPTPLPAQEMDALAEVYHQQYDQLTSQITGLEAQINDLRNLKGQVDDLITEVSLGQASSYAQEAEKYKQLELLLPVATRYLQELSAKQKQVDQLNQQKEDLKAKILDRQGTVPIWWTD